MSVEEVIATPWFKAMLADAPAMERDFEQFKAEFAALSTGDQDFVGRFVKCHLLVEHFLTEYLIAANPQIPALEDIRLNFDMKLRLTYNPHVCLSLLQPAIKCLNQLRNKLVHDIKYRPTADALVPIRAVVEVWSKAAGRSVRDGIDLIEDFAEFVCMNLAGSTRMMRRHAAEDGLIGYIRWHRDSWNETE
jgi:hypothetical protein